MLGLVRRFVSFHCVILINELSSVMMSLETSHLQTRADIRTCLELGVHINCDNLDELERVIEATSAL